MKCSKLARARGAMHDARHAENQLRANYRIVKRQRNQLLDALEMAALNLRDDVHRLKNKSEFTISDIADSIQIVADRIDALITSVKGSQR